jgi:hypothetical protein
MLKGSHTEQWYIIFLKLLHTALDSLWRNDKPGLLSDVCRDMTSWQNTWRLKMIPYRLSVFWSMQPLSHFLFWVLAVMIGKKRQEVNGLEVLCEKLGYSHNRNPASATTPAQWPDLHQRLSNRTFYNSTKTRPFSFNLKIIVDLKVFSKIARSHYCI